MAKNYVEVYGRDGALNPYYILEIWKSIERPSFAKVARIMAERGIISERTGRPYTRQNLHIRLRMIKEGREAIKAKARVRYS